MVRDNKKYDSLTLESLKIATRLKKVCDVSSKKKSLLFCVTAAKKIPLSRRVK